MKRAILAAGMLALAVPSSSKATTTPTGFTGGSTPFSQYQPSLVLQQLVATQGVYPSRSGGDSGSGTELMGMIRTYAGTNDAFGARPAQSQLLPINTNTALFSILNTQFGGNGRTDFALPDLAGRTVVGAGQAEQFYSVGMQTGTATTVLSVANLPPHDHTLPGGGVTSITGSGTAFDNHEPSLTLTEMIAVAGNFPSGSGAQHVFVGETAQFGGNFAPSGWLPADGRLLSISENSALFGVIGTTYGGDGQSTFALPDLRGRTVVGVGQGIGLAAVALGEQFGTASTTLTLAQTPAHDHTLAGGGTTGLAGGGQSFDTYQPSLGLNYIIALQGVFPTNYGNGFPDSNPYLGEVEAFAGDSTPGGWASANGQLLQISQNQALFSLLGTTYGGDGRTTFALPDLRGRSILGTGTGFNLGDKFGSDTTTLTVANLADHDHEVTTASVPEPATWALLLAGFGMTGTAMRRRIRAAPQG